MISLAPRAAASFTLLSCDCAGSAAVAARSATANKYLNGQAIFTTKPYRSGSSPGFSALARKVSLGNTFQCSFSPFPHREVRQLPRKHAERASSSCSYARHRSARPQFPSRSRQRLLVHRPHLRRKHRPRPARPRSISRRQLFSSDRARWCRIRSAGWSRLIFSRLNHGFANRLSTSALRDRAVDSRFGGNRFYARAGSADHRNHARGASRRSLHRGTRHDAGFRGSRSDRGDGHRAAAFSGRAENAGAFFPDALSFHGVEYRSDRRQQPGLARLLSHCLRLFCRSCARRSSYPGHHHWRAKECYVRPAYRRDRLLPGLDRERRRGRRRDRDNLERSYSNYNRDWVRYALQHRLHRVFPHVSAPPSHMVKLRDVTMQFDEKKVLDGLSLEVKPQDRLVIIGQSGSGKSTILRLILGILQPNSGSIFFEQFEITRLSRRKLQQIRRHIGMVYQYSALLSSRTVRDNVALPLEELTTKSRQEIDEIVDEKLALVGMSKSKDLMPSELSGGMKKRVSVARALVLEPELILFDEPGAGLDPVIGSVIDELIISLSEKSKVTSVTVTHEMDSAFRIGTRMAMLYQGKIIEDAEPERFKQSKNPVVAQFLSGSTEGPILKESEDAIATK